MENREDVTFPAPFGLGEAILDAKSREELKPLLQVYDILYGDIPDVLCERYNALPDMSF